LIWLVPTKVFADLLLSVVTLWLTERATRTSLLIMYALTGPRHLRCLSCMFLRRIVLRRNPLCASQRTAKETACNDSCVVTIVGYRGNSVYRFVASIPIWVTVTSLAIWVTCVRFLWKAPTPLCVLSHMDRCHPQREINLHL
jgi:hypothetical protein